MATPSTSPTRPDRPGRGLAGDLILLAGTPDAGSSVPALLRSITQYTADLLPAVSYASVTAAEEDSYVTVALSSESALAVDEAQYAAGDGPCLNALRTADPTSVPRIDATVQWPGFRAEARRLGLHASLSIPLFAGRGTSIAALNLYSHDLHAMAPLSAAVLAIFEGSTLESSGKGTPDHLGPGPAQLVDGLLGAFAVRSRIQQALGVIMAAEHMTADSAYTILCSGAVAGAVALSSAAESVVARAGDNQS